MNENIGNIPSEIKSSIYIGKGFFLIDLAIIAIYSVIIMDTFKFLVSPKLQVVYTVFNVLIAIFLTRPINAKNPQKKIYESIIIYFLSLKRNAYCYKDAEEKQEVKAYEEI